jgi:flagella basal body P-ring formation protein FlgA
MHAYLTTGVSLLTRLCRIALPLAALVPAPGAAESGVQAGSDWQPVAEITATAEAFLRASVGQGDERVVPKAGHLDPRLQLPRCDVPLAPYTQPGSKRTGRLIVGVRCSGEKPWNVYVPVTVAVMEDVVITAHSLPREHVLTQDDLQVVRRDVARLVGGYTSDPADIVGQRLKRGVTQGMVLTSSHLRPVVMIERGQTVTLTVRGGSLNISMAGKALTDGVANQRIRVENLASGRVVEGLVRSPELVEIIVN